ncbi:MAG TPA: class I SAM-dependent methyltransferase [Gaiellaceae bacterium]|nr:class I SAM-dependent methyltransferase [Gaiellaceae bacterium]
MTELPARREPVPVEHIIDRLDDELRRSRQVDGSSPRLAARAKAERLARVSADRPFLYKPGLVGRIRGVILIPIKWVLRRLMRWYVEPVAADQRAFNFSVLALVDSLTERIEAVRQEIHARMDEIAHAVAQRDAEIAQAVAHGEAQTRATTAGLSTRLAEHDDRLMRVERRPLAPATPRAAASAPAPEPAAQPFDYFAFESRMRGPRELIRERQREYVDDFRDAAPVLDVGCGRGEFLSLLAEAGIEAKGVDIDPDMVAFCRGEGLGVEEGDALAYLDRLEAGSLGGIFAAQFVEHLEPGPLTRFIALAASRLRPAGVMVLETINPLSLFALRNYFADLTHAQPLIPETLSLLVKEAGFDRAEVRFLNELEEGQVLESVELPPGPEFDPARRALESNRARLNEVVFGPQDYALVAHR